MIAKVFDKARPTDPSEARGWAAEERMAFLLRRAFEHAPEVHVFHDLRFPTVTRIADHDHFQIDHLVLHRHGMAIVESKATGDGSGEFHVDRLGQWRRVPAAGRKAYNIESPVEQANVQKAALRTFLDAAPTPLLGERFGILQTDFGRVPIAVYVAIADDARVTGDAGKWAGTVMKSERIVDAIEHEIAARRITDGVWFRRSTTSRIVGHLLAHHVGLDSREPSAAASKAPPPAAAVPIQRQAVEAAPAPGRSRSIVAEALACRHCRSIRVGVVYRRDYCLQCEECGKYTPLERRCVRCGCVATVRKRGTEFCRACDLAGGCGAEVVFWRAEESG